MSEMQPNSAEHVVAHLRTYVVEQIKSGADKETIKIRLQAKGVREEIAAELVEKICSETGATAEAEDRTGGSLLPAIIGGGLAAVAAGLVWGLIAVSTGYEIGWVAWGVGLMAGWGVVMFARGQKGLPLQLVAVSAAVLGMAIGKYITFYAALKEYIADEYGAQAVAQMSMLSPGAFQIFGASLADMVGGFDALWILLAVATAWGIPKARLPGGAGGDRQSVIGVR